MISWKRGFFLRENWRAPRSIVCGMFWVAILILFIGMILMVISKHKGRAYVIWGGILLGFGFCIVLVCFLLCLNAYRILAQKNKLPQTLCQQKYNLTIPSSTIIHSTPANQPLNYPHIFVPLQPPIIETSQDKNVPIGKRSEFEKSVSFDRSTFPQQATPKSQKKKVRLQNGDAFDDKSRLDDKVIPDGRGTGSNPTFNVSREVKTLKPHPLSVHDTSKLRNNFVLEENIDRAKLPNNHRMVTDCKPEYLTDDEILLKTRDKENSTRKSHSRTLSNSYQRNTGDETLVENLGSMRVKVRPIKSRLYSPEWVADNSQPSKEDDMMNVIHF